MLCHIFPSLLKQKHLNQVNYSITVQVSSSTQAENPLTLISFSLLFCFLVVSFAVCHAVALSWFMSCLCFVSVSIPLHLKCPVLPLLSLPWISFSILSFPPCSSALDATFSSFFSLVFTTVSKLAAFGRLNALLFKIHLSVHLKSL